MLGAPTNTVLSWLRRARAQLHTMLKEEIEDEVLSLIHISHQHALGRPDALVLACLKVEQARSVDEVVFNALIPVSYTHLDVYKRQLHVQCILTEPEIKNFGYGRIRVGGKPIRFL